jgi:hypothetical protein
MYGLTRASTTLIGAAIAGVLLWLAGDTYDAGAIFEPDLSGRYWGMLGLLAAAGLVLALSQLLGGWTKWGVPRISRAVFLVGFLPALIAGLWVLIYVDPGDYWFADQIESWTDDIGLESFVETVGAMYPALAFGLGLLFGFSFDTSGPRLPSTETVISAPPRSADETGVIEASRPEEPTRIRSEE